MLSDRAISRSLAPHSCLSRRISRTRRIDTLLAGIGPPARHCHDEQSAEYRPAVERLPPLQGWPTSNRNGRHQIGISGRLHSGIGGRLPPEYACSLFCCFSRKLLKTPALLATWGSAAVEFT